MLITAELNQLLYVWPGIDVGRFVADEQYKLETILGLAMSVSRTLFAHMHTGWRHCIV